MASEEVPMDSSKPKDKKMKKNNTKVEKELVLTPSEKALGIRITQPNQKTMDTMTRLYAVPSEKLRVWSSWLTKVGERADDWQWWIRSQIGLALRISENLQRATLALEAEKSVKLGQGDETLDAGTTMPEEDGNNETSTDINEADFEKTVTTTPEQETPSTEEDKPMELENILVAEGEHEDTQQPESEVSEEKSAGEEEGEGEGERGGKNKEKKKGKTGKGGKKQEAKIVYEEGFWPVGKRWKPMSQRSKEDPPPKRQPDVIPMPKNEDEMEELMKKIRHQGVVYRSLYKHWSKTADEAVKHVIGRKVLPTKEVYPNGEEEPYFFYLESEPDINYVIEDDDEEVLLPDPDRERITHEFTHLYFNLSDKPGKGGKPWIY